MARFISLTERHYGPVAVNVDHIRMMWPGLAKGATILRFGDDEDCDIIVEETIDQIITLLGRSVLL